MKTKEIIDKLSAKGYGFVLPGAYLSYIDLRKIIKDVRDIVINSIEHVPTVHYTTLQDTVDKYQGQVERLEADKKRLEQENIDLKLWRSLARTKLLEENGFKLNGNWWERQEPYGAIEKGVIEVYDSKAWLDVLEKHSIIHEEKSKDNLQVISQCLDRIIYAVQKVKMEVDIKV